MKVCCLRGSRCVSASPKPGCKWRCGCAPVLPGAALFCCLLAFLELRQHTFFCGRSRSFGRGLVGIPWWHRWKDPQLGRLSRGVCQVGLASHSAVSSSIGFYHPSELMEVRETDSQERSRSMSAVNTHTQGSPPPALGQPQVLA